MSGSNLFGHNDLYISNGSPLVVQGSPVPPTVLSVVASDGRLLMEIGPEGSYFKGEIEDMGEAAAVFVAEVRRLLPQVTWPA